MKNYMYPTLDLVHFASSTFLVTILTPVLARLYAKYFESAFSWKITLFENDNGWKHLTVRNNV